MSEKKIINRKIKANRVVIKVGTSSLTHESGLINYSHIESLIRQIADLRNRGIEVILVSSGAIGAGIGRLKINKAAASIAQKQALAAVGQNILMHIYLKIAAEYGFDVGQILLTQEDLENPDRSACSKDAILSLLDFGILPIINENDAVAVEEIKYGDNDRLSAMVARLINTDLLIILSDIDGLYDCNPKENIDAKLIYQVDSLSDEVISYAKGEGTKLGTGGMITKLMAVEIVRKLNIPTIIANSNEKNILMRLIDGEVLGTYFNNI